MSELLLGCGHSRIKKLTLNTDETWQWKKLWTLDINRDCKPDFVCDLNANSWNLGLWPIVESTDDAASLLEEPEKATWRHWNFKEDIFDEVHAYEVLEHLGRQGDASTFFGSFYNIWRILRNNGLLFATVPSRFSPWLWGDPGHCRAILPQSLVFLDQTEYIKQLGKTPMSDYRDMWKGDFRCVMSKDDKEIHRFVLQAVKPIRTLVVQE